MSAAISYDSESEVVETDAESRIRLPDAQPHQKYVQMHESDGTIRLVPFSMLDDAERAVLENPELYRQTRQGLADFAAGKSVSSDWLFADE